LVITGTGEETRDFIYVDDLVSGLIRAATVPKARHEAFNLGTGIQTRIQDLAEMVIKACDSRSRIEYAPSRPWDKSLRREADIAKARRVLDFQVSVTVPEACRWLRRRAGKLWLFPFTPNSGQISKLQ
jgi:UDP-glucose 4-epimerase